MGMSQEFPELQFVPAKAYGTGRDGRKVKLSVVHYTAGSERSTSAEDGAAYDQRRTDGTSCHLFHDSNSSVQCVYRWNRANSAFAKGNRLGVHHELCGTQQTRAQWLDAASDATLWRAAKYVADDCRTYGLQPRRLSVAETRATWYSNGPGGIVGHVDITRAFPEDGGTHEDPGPEFPWDVFLARVQQFMTGSEADDMADSWTQPLTQGAPGYAGQQRDTGLAFAWFHAAQANDKADRLLAAAAADEVRDSATLAAVKALAVATGLDPAPILDAIGAARDEAHASFAALQQQLAEAQARNVKLAAALAAAGGALDAADD